MGLVAHDGFEREGLGDVVAEGVGGVGAVLSAFLISLVGEPRESQSQVTSSRSLMSSVQLG